MIHLLDQEDIIEVLKGAAEITSQIMVVLQDHRRRLEKIEKSLIEEEE